MRADGVVLKMPVARYFLYVGGVLLALLFAFDATQPKLPVAAQTEAAAAVDMPVVRIQSDRKWPEKVVFDTNVPTIVPAPVVQAAAAVPAPVAAPAPAAEMSAKARVRESFAQFADTEHKKPEALAQPKPKRKVAKHRANPPMMMVAQQRQQFGFGWFGNTW